MSSDEPKPPGREGLGSVFAYSMLVGLGLSLVASAANFAISIPLTNRWLQAWTDVNGHAGSTYLSLGFFLGNLVGYPALLIAYLVLTLPTIALFSPHIAARQRFPTYATVLATLAFAAMWYAGPDLLLIYTLPAVGGATLATLLTSRLIRSLCLEYLQPPAAGPAPQAPEVKP